MPTLKLRLWLFTEWGGPLATSQGMSKLPVLIFDVQGGKQQPLHNGQYIENEKLVAEEMRDAIFRGNLFVVRDSDDLSLELYKAYKQRNKFMVIAAVTSVASSGIRKYAHLIITNAYIKEFKTRQTQPGSGRPGHKNWDGILFSFESCNANLSFGSNSEEIFKREVEKVAGTIAGRGGSVR